MRGRTHSRTLKLEVVRQINSGAKRQAQICREHGLSESLVHRWRKEYAERGEAAFTPRQVDELAALQARVAELERHCGQLSYELALAKKALEHAPSPTAMR